MRFIRYFDFLTKGIIASDPNYEFVDIIDLVDLSRIHKFRDKSKAIAAEHWDNLSPEAQQTLSDNGFFRYDENDIIEM